MSIPGKFFFAQTNKSGDRPISPKSQSFKVSDRSGVDDISKIAMRAIQLAVFVVRKSTMVRCEGMMKTIRASVISIRDGIPGVWSVISVRFTFWTTFFMAHSSSCLRTLLTEVTWAVQSFSSLTRAWFRKSSAMRDSNLRWMMRNSKNEAVAPVGVH